MLNFAKLNTGSTDSESCCTPETNVMYVNYASIKNNKHRKDKPEINANGYLQGVGGNGVEGTGMGARLLWE